MRNLGTLPLHAEASRGGTSSCRPGSNHAETPTAKKEIYHGETDRRDDQAEHREDAVQRPRAGAHECACGRGTGAAWRGRQVPGKRGPRAGLRSRCLTACDPHRAGVKARAEHGNSLETTPAAPVVGGFLQPLSGGMTTSERFWNAPPQAERHARRSCHPNAAGDLSRFWIGKAPVKRTPKGIRKAGAQRPALDQSVGETRQGRQAREMLRHYPATSAHACNCGAPRAGAATSHQRGAALDPKGAA